jgi:hypothetical protein
MGAAKAFIGRASAAAMANVLKQAFRFIGYSSLVGVLLLCENIY